MNQPRNAKENIEFGQSIMFGLINTLATAVLLALLVSLLAVVGVDLGSGRQQAMYLVTLVPLFVMSVIVHPSYCQKSAAARFVGFMANGATIALIFPFLALIADGNLDGFGQSIAPILLLATLGACWASVLWLVNELFKRVIYTSA